jgi:cell shape-determining protein MreC
MQTPDLIAEISVLEEQLAYYKKLLDKAFSDNLQFAETKVIFHEVKKLSDKLAAVKSRAAG